MVVIDGIEKLRRDALFKRISSLEVKSKIEILAEILEFQIGR